MVKSNLRTMPKPKRRVVDPELLKKVEDLERRMAKTDVELAVALARAKEAAHWLRLITASR